MRTIIATTALLLSISTPCFSVTSTTEQINTRIQRLEAEVSQLKKENTALSDRLSELQELVTERLLPLAITATSGQGTCMEKIESLEKKRDDLKKLGLQDRHPDVERIAAQIHAVSSDC
ncbi:hypothetical protein [Kordiimonas sp.]|uniref:hypothetical protein n=1 Tax=Kordiimonas sp. TaxID=1970157 RepID=UPI003B52F31A